ncbi:hypothetical protein CMQ_7355 [Grosmannia clavigera kw1407]|uniref:DUF7704 domain-containing protein n=1 Tax=Grosmannia clavigera (strain kw1407 / UAMH 11150) TaxID=655863 RepID=F0XPH8_GROCL|nr:uncharacterized protein CMQ_7355 [Grosmannia clavigera kw1407]EFX00353.1 hypothetical protein CMQ_7355 [Grosmannia clavigera kw1407]
MSTQQRPQPAKAAAAPYAVARLPTATIGLPVTYRLFFLLFEPLSALAGAYFAHFAQHDYLTLTDAASAPASAVEIPRATAVVLSQLANLYLLFAINEALVLRSTADLRVWKTVLSGLLLADFGHLYALRPLGLDVYWRADRWNAMDMGNVPFVYLGACMRMAFLAGIGLARPSRGQAKPKKN